jgi:predicted Zn-dependent protease
VPAPCPVAVSRLGRRVLLRGLGTLLAGGTVSGCATNPVTGRSQLMLLSEQEEMEMGRKAFTELNWQDGGPLRVDPAVQAYLQGVVKKLHQVSHRSSLPVDFTLQSASEPNAWALPGHTAMNRGLLQQFPNEAQFAFVMGHEMGHVAARHSASRQSKGMVTGGTIGILGAAAEAALGGVGSLAAGVAGAGAQLMLLSFDRGQELEADELGTLYMARAGYDPQEALGAHASLNQAIDVYLGNLGKKRTDSGGMSQILSTHPRHEDRLKQIEDYLKTIPASERRQDGDGKFADRWMAATEPVRRLAPAYARYDKAKLAFIQAVQASEQRQEATVRAKLGEAEREIQAAMALADQAQFATLQGYILAGQGKRGDARGAFNRAVSLYPGYQPALRALARLRP